MNFLSYVKDIVIPVVKAEGFQPDNVPSDANVLLKRVLNILLLIVVAAAVVYIMLAGIQYVTSQGDATKAKTAMSSITNAIIGLVVAFAAYALVSLVMNNIIGSSISPLPTGVAE